MKRSQKDCPNPLFEKWLTEMKEQAEANDNPIQYSIGKALSSLRKCPIRLETGKDCMILQYFGKKICDILDRKLAEYKKINNLPSTSRSSAIRDILGDEDEDVGGKRIKKTISTEEISNEAGSSNERPVFKIQRNKPYIPKIGSGAYAILITIYNNMQEPNYPGYMLKKDIVSQAQRHCDSPMKSNTTEHYSGWSSMSTLIAKHYVIKQNNPAKYSLTDSGIDLSLSLIEGRAKHYCDSDDEDEDNDRASSKKQSQNKSSGKGKSKSGSSVSSESDSTKASTSGKDNLKNDSSDLGGDVFDTNNKKNSETNDVKTKKSQATEIISDDELETALELSLIDVKLKKLHDSFTTNNERGADAAFEDELEMVLALSLNETKMKNVDLDVHDDNYLSDDGKLKTIGIAAKDSETDMDEDLKAALSMSLEEMKLRSTYPHYSPDHINDQVHNSERRLVNEFGNTNGSKPNPGLSSKDINNENEIICLDDDDDNGHNIENSFDKIMKNNSQIQSKSEDTNLNCSESYLEFCKENVEPTLCVKKKNKHFIFTDGPRDFDLNKRDDETFVKKKNIANIQISSKNISLVGNSKKEACQEEIVISDDDEDVRREMPARTDILISSPVKNKKTPTKIDKLSKENVQRTDKVISTISKNVNEKGKSQTDSKSKETPKDVSYDSFNLLPNNFDIILLVDTQETSGSKRKPTDDATMSALTDAGVLFEIRSLKVGDFAWIAKCRFTQKELVLPYIIERKRLDDLSGSITDGRYHEQKHRLRQSGINNVIYLIEHYGKNYHGVIPLTSLFQAGINTTVQDGFITKYTRDHKDSMFYLAVLTRKLIKMYKSKELISCPKSYINSVSRASEDTERLMEFNEFNKAALKTKQFTVREMLIKQLVQLKGMSAEKAIGIAELYPSPLILAEALRKEGKNLLADIEVGSSRRKIGPTISNVLYLFYTRTNLN